MFITLIMVIEPWSMDMSKLIKSFMLNMQFFMCAHCILIMMLKIGEGVCWPWKMPLPHVDIDNTIPLISDSWRSFLLMRGATEERN